MQPITIKELADFLQIVIDAFDEPLFFAMTAMFAGVVGYHIKRIMLE